VLHRAGLAFRAGVVDGCIQAAEARDRLIDQIADLIVALNAEFSSPCCASAPANKARPSRPPPTIRK